MYHCLFCCNAVVVVAALLLLQLTPFKAACPAVLFPALLLMWLTPVKAAFADVFNVVVAVVFVRFAMFDVAIDDFVFVPFPAF